MINRSVIWIDLDRVDLNPGAKPMKLGVVVHGNLGGEAVPAGFALQVCTMEHDGGRR